MLEMARTCSSWPVWPRAARWRSRSQETSKWSSIAFLPLPVTMMIELSPEATASSITYWMIGLSTSGSISFGCAFVAGRKRVPRPAAGKTALRILRGEGIDGSYHAACEGPVRCVLSCPVMLDLKFVVENRDLVLGALAARGQDLAAIQAFPGLAGVDPWALD